MSVVIFLKVKRTICCEKRSAYLEYVASINLKKEQKVCYLKFIIVAVVTTAIIAVPRLSAHCLDHFCLPPNDVKLPSNQPRHQCPENMHCVHVVIIWENC